MSESILVTGGAGYIGSHTCKLLASHGYTPVVLDTLEKGHLEFVKWGPFVQGSTQDTDLVTQILKQHSIRGVIHFAAYIEVGESVQNPLKYYHNNVLGTVSLLRAMQEAHCKNLIFSSSAAVYAESANPLKETDLLEPKNPYGASKLYAERVIQDFCLATGAHAVALRYFNACGADHEGELGESHDPETHLIPKALQSLTRHKPFKLFGMDYPTTDGTCIRDYIHVEDLAQAHLLGLEKLLNDRASKPFEVYNVGTGKGLSVLQILKEIEIQTTQHLKYEITPRRAGDPMQLVARVNKIEAELGFVAHASDLSRMIQSAWQWEQKLALKHK